MQITKRTIISTVINLIALINTIMIMLGKPVLPISDDQASTFVSVILTICAWIYGFWKNNSFTPEAIKADEVLDLMRKGEWFETEDQAVYYEDDDDEEEGEVDA